MTEKIADFPNTYVFVAVSWAPKGVPLVPLGLLFFQRQVWTHREETSP